MNWRDKLAPYAADFQKLMPYCLDGSLDNQRLARQWCEFGFNSRKARNKFASLLIGRPIESFLELTPNETTTLQRMVESDSGMKLLVLYMQAKEDWVLSGEVKVRTKAKVTA